MTTATAALSATIDLPTTPASVPAARHLVGHLLAAWSVESLHEDSVLLLSELITNVVRHVGPRALFTVHLRLSELILRIAVVDVSPAPAVLRQPTAGGGHGMRLVDAVADRWGSEEHGTGKQVWFELRARPDRRDATSISGRGR